MSQFPIRTVSERTGIPTTTLRAWERRYGLLKPARTAKGHRLYSQQDIDLVKNIVRLLKQNHTISEAIRLLNDPQTEAVFAGAGVDHWQHFCDRILNAIEHFNETKLDRAYSEALSLYPIDMVTEHVILPVLKTLGERWQDRQAGIAEEHFFSAYLRNKLGARLHHDATLSRGRRVLVSCLPGEYHELGVLLFCLAAIGSGYQILYLGTDLPISQIPYVVSKTTIDAVLLSGTRADNWGQSIRKELASMIQAVEVPVLFGGDISDAHDVAIQSIGAIALGSDHVSAMEKMETLVPAFG